MMVLSLWSAHFPGEEVRVFFCFLLQLEPEAVPVKKKQVGSGVCSVLACGVRVLFAPGGVAPLSAGTDGCPLWAQVHPLLPLPPRRNPSALACLPAVLRRRACLGGRKVAVQLSKPCETLHSPFMYISLYSPFLLRVSLLPVGARRWHRGKGSEESSEANPVCVLSCGAALGDLEQLRACVCSHEWHYRCISICYPDCREEAAGIQGCFQTWGLCPTASSESQGTAVSSLLRLKTWCGEGKESGWGAGAGWDAMIKAWARSGQRFASLHYVPLENGLRALAFISFLMN